MTTPHIPKPLPGGCNVGCGTCAFREGSETRREPYNAMKSKLCELGGVPFYCHHLKNGEDIHASEEKPPVRQLVICEGWKQAMREHAHNPQWRRQRKLRKAFAELAMGALDKLVDNDDQEDRTECLRIIRQAVEILVLKRPKKLRLVSPPIEKAVQP